MNRDMEKVKWNSMMVVHNLWGSVFLEIETSDGNMYHCKLKNGWTKGVDRRNLNE